MVFAKSYKFYLIVFFASAALIACSGKKGDNAQAKGSSGELWKIIDVDVTGGFEGNEDASFDNCFLSLYEDGSYTFFLKGFYSEGKIVHAGNEYKMMQGIEDKLVAVFNMKKGRSNEATLVFTMFDEKAIQKTNNGDGVAHSTELPVGSLSAGFSVDVEKEKRGVKADPYAAKYNKWRIRASHKETDKEIKDRVRNHVEFMQMYFENALELKKHVVYEPNLASPFEVYSNGISMRKFEEISDWQSLFFDEEDAKKSYDMVNVEMSKRFDLLDTKNGFELNADIFRKLLKVMD